MLRKLRKVIINRSKLKKNGFTLIELLAVVVILAIVMVVTIPSVLNSMESARQKQFENAVHSIEEYVQKNLDLCNLGGDLASGSYDTSIFGTNNCTVKTDTTVITAAGYKTSDIASVTGAVNANGKYVISAATAGADGQFKGASYPAA